MAVEIASEEQLWALLATLLEESSGEKAVADLRLAISGWQPELLYFPDDKIESSFAPATAKAIAEFHGNLRRGYAYLTHGRLDQRSLTDEEKTLLEIRILLKPGSNGFNIVDAAIDAIVQGVVNKMTGGQITLIVVVFLILFFGSGALRYFLRRLYDERARAGAASERATASAEETKRTNLLVEALRREPQLQPLLTESDESKVALLRAAATSDHARVAGVPITAGEAQELLDKKGTDEVGNGRRIDGTFKVENIATEHDFGFVVRLRNSSTEEEFNAEASYSEMPAEDIHAIFVAAEEKTTIVARVNGFYQGERLVRAVIVRADPAG